MVEEIGSENVVQVITDNASNVEGAGLMIQAKYCNIYRTPLHCALPQACVEGDMLSKDA